MFIHWDHASQRSWELSWPLVGGVFSLPYCQDVPVAEYHGLAATFNPTQWDPGAVARTAKAIGMRYVVFTTKHHNGYAMFDSKVSTHTVMQSPCERDLVRETFDAIRAEGLRVGAYFSLSDWHHPDYPAFTEEMKPYVFPSSPPLPTPEQADRYHQYLRAQLTELLTGYGPIDMMWFDGAWERPDEWWRARELEELIRSLQPGVLINNRLPGCGDFDTPEQFVPPTAPDERWEACLTMNESWGWNTGDAHYKSSRQIIHRLCETAGRNGNLLLNVSPRGDGSLPPEQVDRLQDIGRWMARYHSAIHGTVAGLAPWQFYGPSTRSGERINLFLLSRPYDSITVRGLPIRRIKRVVELASGVELDFETRAMILDQRLPDPNGETQIRIPEHLLDEFATVVAVDIEPKG